MIKNFEIRDELQGVCQDCVYLDTTVLNVKQIILKENIKQIELLQKWVMSEVPTVAYQNNVYIEMEDIKNKLNKLKRELEMEL